MTETQQISVPDACGGNDRYIRFKNRSQLIASIGLEIQTNTMILKND